MIRVLVVDDSPLVRELLTDYLGSTPGMEVCAAAADGREALRIVKQLKPDVVTLDIEMPGMNGLKTLAALLAEYPVPVIMASALTQRGADVTLEALELGALDYVGKTHGSDNTDRASCEELVRKIRAMAGTDVRRVLEIRRQRAAKRELKRPEPLRPGSVPATKISVDEYADKCIAIGISTGGPPALSALFATLEPPLPPIVVVQHMPAHFTGPFAWRLNSSSKLLIKEAATGDVLLPNQVLIAPGGKHLYLRPEGKQTLVRVRDGEPVSGHKPSADVMMECVADIFGPRALGIIMTGMGRDGAAGCGKIRAAGGYVLGQNEATSDVYGMNKVAYLEGNVDRQFALDDAARLISQQCKRLWGRTAVGV